MQQSKSRTGLVTLVLPLFILLAVTCSFPAAASGLGPSLKWIEKEKIKGISYYYPAAGKEGEFVKTVKDLGFNTFLLLEDGTQVNEHMTTAFALAGKYGLHVFWVFHFGAAFSLPEVKTMVGDRRFTSEDGVRHENSGCPFDEKYWEVEMAARALSLAKASKDYPGAAGILFDVEDYGGIGVWGGPCYCDDCFDSFAQSQGLSVTHENVPAAKRKEWLSSQGLFAKYDARQHDEIARIGRNIRRRIDEINPDLLAVSYPWPGLPYDDDFIRGFGTERAPFVCLAEYTYKGYRPDFPERAKAVRDKGLHALFVPGIGCYVGVDLGPMWTAANCFYAATQADGYWIYEETGGWGRGEKWSGGAVPGTPAQWARWIRFANEELDRWVTTPGYKSKLPLLRDRLLDTQGIPETRLRPLRHSQGSAVRFQRLSDLGEPWAGREILLEGKGTGDYLEFKVEVPVADTYSIRGFLSTGPTRGIIRLFVDGNPAGDPVDLYSPSLEVFPSPSGWVRFPLGGLAPLGQVALGAGPHTFRLQLVGRNRAAAGHEVGIRGILLKAVSEAPFVRDWSVIGPFPGGNYQSLGKRFPPEDVVDLEAAYEGAGGEKVQWKRLEAEDNGWLDMRKAFGVPVERGGMGYALTYVNSATDQMVNLRLGTGGGCRLWVNRQLVWKRNESRGGRPDQDQIAVSLRQGRNVVLIKVEQHPWDSWGVFLRCSGSSQDLVWEAP